MYGTGGGLKKFELLGISVFQKMQLFVFKVWRPNAYVMCVHANLKLFNTYITICRQWAGSCKSKLQLNVNYRKKFGLVCKLLAKPAQIFILQLTFSCNSMVHDPGLDIILTYLFCKYVHSFMFYTWYCFTVSSGGFGTQYLGFGFWKCHGEMGLSLRYAPFWKII